MGKRAALPTKENDLPSKRRKLLDGSDTIIYDTKAIQSVDQLRSILTFQQDDRLLQRQSAWSKSRL